MRHLFWEFLSRPRSGWGCGTALRCVGGHCTAPTPRFSSQAPERGRGGGNRPGDGCQRCARGLFEINCDFLTSAVSWLFLAAGWGGAGGARVAVSLSPPRGDAAPAGRCRGDAGPGGPRRWRRRRRRRGAPAPGRGGPPAARLLPPLLSRLMVFAHLYVLNVLGCCSSCTSAPASPAGRPPPHSRRRRRPPAPPALEGIKVGHTQRVELVPGRAHAVRTLSLKPLLFEIPDFLTEEECKLIVHLAKLKGLQKSQILPTEDYEEAMEMIEISQMDIFNLLDHNQDGQLQLKEVDLWATYCENSQAPAKPPLLMSRGG
uniref:Prolyl 4-hydroxylase, transmembrane n=1 Tax=Malurus cyaneus samueli TaxID=2593467 RepID=A0A8C5THZ4_9PASS